MFQRPHMMFFFLQNTRLSHNFLKYSVTLDSPIFKQTKSIAGLFYSKHMLYSFTFTSTYEQIVNFPTCLLYYQITVMNDSDNVDNNNRIAPIITQIRFAAFLIKTLLMISGISNFCNVTSRYNNNFQSLHILATLSRYCSRYV